MARMKQGSRTTLRNPSNPPLGSVEREAVKLYNDGVPVREIMRRLGIRSTAKLYRILKKYANLRKSKRKKWKPSEEEVRELCKLKAEGWSIYQIARYFERSPSTIWHYARKFCSSSG